MMHPTTVLGILLIAIGTWLTYWGQGAQSRAESRKVEAKIESVRQEISDARTEPGGARKAHLDSVEAGFNEWADDLVKNRSSKVLERERRNIVATSAQLEISKVVRPVLQEILDAIRSSCSAYAARTGASITVSLPPLPENLFESATGSEYLGKVIYSDHVGWLIRVFSSGSASEREAPRLSVALYDPKVEGSYVAGNYMYTRIDYSEKTVEFNFQGETFPRPVGELSHIRYGDGMEPVRRAVRSIVEAQLLELK